MRASRVESIREYDGEKRSTERRGASSVVRHGVAPASVSDAPTKATHATCPTSKGTVLTYDRRVREGSAAAPAAMTYRNPPAGS